MNGLIHKPRFLKESGVLCYEWPLLIDYEILYETQHDGHY